MGDKRINLLIIEDEGYDVRRIQNTLKPYSNKIHISDIVSNGNDGLKQIKEGKDTIDVVIMDFQISGGLKGESLIREIKKLDPTIQIIVVTKMTLNQSDYDFANRLLDAGAFWYCTKYPTDIERYIYQPTDFILSIINAYEKRKLENESHKSLSRLEGKVRDILKGREIIGESPAILELRGKIEKYCDSTASVIIYGESGVGKELVATHIHYLSPRRYENLVTINCGSIPHELIESELFGFVKGSFTGAGETRAGFFEKADKGTVFLDEVAELPMSAQAKLLRVLENGEIDKIGRKTKQIVDVRVLAATNTNLEELVAEKRFRKDLYYRLNVLQINVPALDQRRSDIPIIFKHFVKRYSYDMGKQPPKIEERALEMLESYEWPGNIRQVKNVVQRLLHEYEGSIKLADVESVLDVGSSIGVIGKSGIRFDSENIQSLKDFEIETRRQYVEFVRSSSASDAEAARKLGIAPSNYHRMSKDLGLK